MTSADAIAWLDGLTNYERAHRPDAMRQVQLERMQRLCGRLGDPQRRFRAVLVAGTNGKGSIAAMLYSMLRESRLRAGLYTSPHVEHLRERIRMWTEGPTEEERCHGDDWISEEELVQAASQVRAAVAALAGEEPESPPTYFEAVTAMAFCAFARRDVELAVLEVGLGGRLDATNVVEQAVSVIGPIDVDHQDVLGCDPVTIAREKAAIIKARQIAITAPQHGEVLAVLRRACESYGVPLLVGGEDVTARIERHDLDGLQISLTGQRGIYESLELPLLGRHQAMNAALAVAALEALSTSGIPHTLVERGLSRIVWPGRLEPVHDEPLVLMDGAHNPHAAGTLAATLTELFPERRVHLLIGMSSDKAVEGVGQALAGLAASATCTKSRHPRALDPMVLAKRLAPYCADVHVMSDAADAYTYLLNAVSPEDVIVVMGSLFLVGELRAALRSPLVGVRRPAAA